jgi:phytoene desaturase
MKVAIIGAGIAGMCAAVRMASRGYEVDLYEKSDKLGGKLHSFTIDEYRFDFGPSLFTMPQYLEELFTLADINIESHFQYEKLDVLCRYFWDDGIVCDTFTDLKKSIDSISKSLDENPKKIEQHFHDSKIKYELTGRTFLENSLHKWKTWLTKDVAFAFTKLHKLDLLTTMHKVNKSRFDNKKTIQLFDRYATYNGSNPYKAPGLLNIIPHFEYGFGAFIPKKGMYQITTALHELGLKLGVKYHTGTDVVKIIVKDNQSKGIQLRQGDIINFDTVISNCDAYYTYKNLLDDHTRSQDILKQERSSSALIFYWGVDRSFNELDLHNIFFSNDYKQEFDAIAAGTICNDPTVYIHITSKYVKDDAPQGCENWFTMINVPYNDGQDWDSLIQKARKDIINKLNKVLKVDITQHITCEEVLDPRRIQSQTSSHTGSLYGTSSNNKWAAFARQPNESSHIKDLYFLGGSVHPGGGLPLCMLSAKIVDELIHE